MPCSSRQRSLPTQWGSGGGGALYCCIPRDLTAGTTTGGAQNKTPKQTVQDQRQEAVDLILETMEALLAERGEEDKIWGSMVKQALKRRQPGFNESYYGFRSFSALLEEAEKRQLLALERDEKSGGYLLRLLAHEG